jgi:hypothetical protein
MPVDLHTLEHAQRPLRDRIVEFLSKNPGTAFNEYEVYAAVEGFTPESAAALALLVMVSNRRPAGYDECREALETLVAEGHIDAAQFQGSRQYYVRPA